MRTLPALLAAYALRDGGPRKLLDARLLVSLGATLIALPLMLGLSLTTVDEWYEKYFGQAVGVGVVAVLGFSRHLVQAPPGSRSHVEGRIDHAERCSDLRARPNPQERCEVRAQQEIG